MRGSVLEYKCMVLSTVLVEIPANGEVVVVRWCRERVVYFTLPVLVITFLINPKALGKQWPEH